MPARGEKKLAWVCFDECTFKIGLSDDESGFHFDNETPVHNKIITSFCLSETLVTNGDYLAFIEDGGYKNPALWLSEGWSQKQANQWEHPLYWRKDEHNGWVEFTLAGETPIDHKSPVVHLSYYEAKAYASWDE